MRQHPAPHSSLLTPHVSLLALVLLAFVLRMIGLGDVPPRWDEGWSIAHASLNWGELFTITSADVHPPLFYMLLGLWQSVTGIGLFGARYLAVLMSLPAVPLTYAVARVWCAGLPAMRARHSALIAAGLMAWLPLAVYYSAVIRMYALAPTFVLLATWGALRLAGRAQSTEHRAQTADGGSQKSEIGNQMHDRTLRAWHLTPGTWHLVAFVAGASGAMLTLYHAVWALGALGVYAFGVALAVAHRERRWRRVALLGAGVGLALLVFTPWAIYAVPQFLQRAADSAGNVAQQYPISYFVELGIYGLTMSQQTGMLGIATIVLIVVAGLVGWVISGRTRNLEPSTQHLLRLVLPVFTIAITLLGVAAAARNWAFNERMLICAAPALALLLAWALDALSGASRASRVLAGLAVLLLIGVYWNTSTDFVYQKSLEVFDPYNPHTYHEHIAPYATPQDVVFFNVLSPAGFYALDRTSADPAWSYALTWDPVIEPRARWEARIAQAAREHERLWVVLYRGLAGANGDLRGWLDSNFYPARAEWGEEGVFYGLYGAVGEPLVPGTGAQTRWGELVLQDVRVAKTVKAGAVIPVDLTWRAGAPVAKNYKVFVHTFDASGALVAQHDAQPLNDLRPMTTFPLGEDVSDHHGLALPATAHGSLRLVAGLYDPDTGQRLRTNDGQETIEIGTVDVVSAP
jgi:4-amino-4-deoxy-L-arabinose transferase-like glycosyltransferase